ncbi:MAG: peptide deformylase [Burkholderiaceae bacterium]|jgi:peptide deformylase|nr:peptide deformylase [Burkholderiaceae bacterium]
MLLPILHYPDPRLYKAARPVEAIDACLKTLIADMFETMYAAKGVGLAATQVDVHQRLVVIDVSETRDQPLALINPELVWASAERIRGEEGCLSVPGIYDEVARAAQVRVRALDENGQPREIEAEGFLAVCLQHELDHLAGKVFVQYLSMLKQSRIKAKLRKQEREAQQEAARQREQL